MTHAPLHFPLHRAWYWWVRPRGGSCPPSPRARGSSPGNLCRLVLCRLGPPSIQCPRTGMHFGRNPCPPHLSYVHHPHSPRSKLPLASTDGPVRASSPAPPALTPSFPSLSLIQRPVSRAVARKNLILTRRRALRSLCFALFPTCSTCYVLSLSPNLELCTALRAHSSLLTLLPPEDRYKNSGSRVLVRLVLVQVEALPCWQRLFNA